MSEFLKKFRFELTLVAVIVGLSLIFVLVGDKVGFFSDREAVLSAVENFGPWGPLLIILISFVDVLIAPFPGGISPSISGFVFGELTGTLLVLIGNILGANAVFWIARLWGKRFFLLFIKESKIDEFRQMVETHQKLFWTAFFIPVLPYDVLNIAIGLSDIPWKRFLLLNTLGMTVGMSLLTFFGSSFAELLFR